MPEYLAPGVYIEETSFRAKVIEGVSTTTTGFIGPTRFGPTDIESEVITSLGEFERIYGDRQPLHFVGVPEPMPNFMWHAARAFFEQGGKRVYVCRVFSPEETGFAEAWLPGGAAPTTPTERRRSICVRARHPGALGRMRVRLTLILGQNILGSKPDPDHPGQTPLNTVNGLLARDIVWISDLPGSPPAADEQGDFYLAEAVVDPVKGTTWHFTTALAGTLSSPPSSLALAKLVADPNPKHGNKIRVVTLTVTVMPTGESDLPPQVWSGLPLDPDHTRAGEPDSVFDRFAKDPSSLAQARRLPIVIERGRDSSDATELGDGIDVLRLLFQTPGLREAPFLHALGDERRRLGCGFVSGPSSARSARLSGRRGRSILYVFTASGEYHGIERLYRVMQRKLFTTHKVNLIGTRELGCFFAERLDGDRDGILQFDKRGMLQPRPWLSLEPMDWHLFNEFVLPQERWCHGLP
jgi:hypothetical protein